MGSAAFRTLAKRMYRRSDTLYEDATIAVIAKTNGLTVVMRNVTDFAHFDVSLPNPFEGVAASDASRVGRVSRRVPALHGPASASRGKPPESTALQPFPGEAACQHGVKTSGVRSESVSTCRGSGSASESVRPVADAQPALHSRPEMNDACLGGERFGGKPGRNAARLAGVHEPIVTGCGPTSARDHCFRAVNRWVRAVAVFMRSPTDRPAVR